jgi:hypothetical protein
MNNIVSLYRDKRWKAVIEYRVEEGLQSTEHYFEEILDLHSIIEHGPDWNRLVKCVVTLNRHDDGADQNPAYQARSRDSHGQT